MIIKNKCSCCKRYVKNPKYTTLNEAIKDIEKETELCYIKDKIIHDKAVFEKEYLDMVDKLKNAELRIAELNEKIKSVRNIL